jgi:redox-sensitive bicupin YhaK (pirin superfamily)
MITVRRAEERGAADHGWLDTRHTFSFADYFDERHLGFRNLRVLNEDRVLPGQGFGAHGHRDMEILSYVLEGALRHRDSTGSEGVLVPGDVQRMSAGSGVRHSEVNGSATAPVHFLQIWLHPSSPGLAPSHEHRHFPPAELQGRLRLLAAPGAPQGALDLHADAAVYATRLAAGEAATLPLRPGRHAWVQVARGQVEVNGVALRAGDGAALGDEALLTLSTATSGEALVFDLA